MKTIVSVHDEGRGVRTKTQTRGSTTPFAMVALLSFAGGTALLLPQLAKHLATRQGVESAPGPIAWDIQLKAQTRALRPVARLEMYRAPVVLQRALGMVGNVRLIGDGTRNVMRPFETVNVELYGFPNYVFDGDRVKVGPGGLATLRFEDGSVLLLGENSVYVVGGVKSKRPPFGFNSIRG